ncbi:MAG: twitching motility protein PilT [Candidatus Schekmanbacteria bacterium RBG_16_38_10]|uniref:Twitching motility protein PilT n=1 Tax=Candidatus Schekmanbacteria bacterium RBG_16_38_10 TaxID=1817879 RepID=A0A1F7RZZ4_9BACT|nr:MAG: twitching motility protein PilT [Candidatus Schekmanbacteria bacterium RBG_16_38_10]
MLKGQFIFDSHALLKFFQKEKGYEKVVHILEDIKKTGSIKYINAINLGEIIYSTKREFGDQKKLEVLANIERLNFTILPVPNSLIFQAAEYKAQYSISYADCFVLASALEHKAVIVTGDPEFKKVEHLVKVVWV